MTQNNSATLDNDPQETREWLDSLESVSYTHLTLPTIYSV